MWCWLTFWRRIVHVGWCTAGRASSCLDCSRTEASPTTSDPLFSPLPPPASFHLTSFPGFPRPPPAPDLPSVSSWTCPRTWSFPSRTRSMCVLGGLGLDLEKKSCLHHWYWLERLLLITQVVTVKTCRLVKCFACYFTHNLGLGLFEDDVISRPCVWSLVKWTWCERPLRQK